MRISVQYSSGRNGDGRLYVRTEGTVLTVHTTVHRECLPRRRPLIWYVHGDCVSLVRASFRIVLYSIAQYTRSVTTPCMNCEVKC